MPTRWPIRYEKPYDTVLKAYIDSLVEEAITQAVNLAREQILGGDVSAALDTIAEINAALGDDANLAGTLTSLINAKADSSALQAHIDEVTAAHAASAIFVDDNTFIPEDDLQLMIENWGVWWWISKNWVAGKYDSMAKGGLLVASGLDEYTQVLAAGTNGKALVADSSQLAGLKYDWLVPSANVWRRDINLAASPNALSAGTWNHGGSFGFTTAGASAPTYHATWYTDLQPGTWAGEIYLTKSNNSGIVTIEYSVDGGNTWVPISANLDLYNATNLVHIVTVSGIVVTEPKRLDLRIRGMGSKHASSSAYYFLSSNASFRRTA